MKYYFPAGNQVNRPLPVCHLTEPWGRKSIRHRAQRHGLDREQLLIDEESISPQRLLFYNFMDPSPHFNYFQNKGNEISLGFTRQKYQAFASHFLLSKPPFHLKRMFLPFLHEYSDLWLCRDSVWPGSRAGGSPGSHSTIRQKSPSVLSGLHARFCLKEASLCFKNVWKTVI